MRWNILKKKETPASAAEPDLLEEAEEAAFQAAVRPRPPVEEASQMPVVAPILWEEQETTFKPAQREVAPFLMDLPQDDSLEDKPGQPLIFVRRTAQNALQAHLRQNITVELGGLLLGPVYHDPQRKVYWLIVEQALPATNGIETAISFEYTAESWTNLFPQLQQMDATWTILGSYHSHPGIGVFLSPTDLATQTDVFPNEWQIAVVVDPIANETGFFIGPEGKPCLHWHLLD